MNRYWITFACTLLNIVAFGQKATFNIKYSEQLAVFVFMQQLSDDYRDNVYKTAFTKSKYNVDEYNTIRTNFGKLNIDYSYQFEEFPYNAKMPMQTRDIIKKNLLETADLNEFKRRSVGILPNKTLNDLAACITAFIPVYNDLIYRPNKTQFERQLVEIEKYANDHHIEAFFETGLRFYNASWDNAIPFEIAFYPLPNSDNFTAQAFCNNFISAIQTNLKDYKDLFSVMMHETYHIIYNEQSLEIKTQVDGYFKEQKSNSSNYANLIMNEVLATALGNGYVYKELAGAPDTKEWYYHKYIDLLARKIFPLVTEYISQKKSIDKNFIDSYINLYETNFPNWINEPENIMTYRYVLSENSEDFNTVRGIFWYCSCEENDTAITENSLDKMIKTPLTKLLIVS